MHAREIFMLKDQWHTHYHKVNHDEHGDMEATCYSYAHDEEVICCDALEIFSHVDYNEGYNSCNITTI